MNPLLQIENLRFTVPTGHIIQKKKTVLKDISLSIQHGQATAYLGPNGAGKTSTFRILCGLSRPDSGSITFAGQKITAGIPAKSFGFMPEQPYFYKNLTPLDLLRSFGRLSGITSGLDKKIAMWSEKLHFENVLTQALSKCSKGQVQRVGLAQALIHEPDFILLDEPLSGLDPLGRNCVKNAIQDEIRRGATILFSSHILSDVESICEQLVILNAGEVIFSGEASSLLSSNDEWLIHFKCPDSSISHFGDFAPRRNTDGSWQLVCSAPDSRDRAIKHILDNTEDAQLISVTPSQKTLEQAFVHILQSSELST